MVDAGRAAVSAAAALPAPRLRQESGFFSIRQKELLYFYGQTFLLGVLLSFKGLPPPRNTDCCCLLPLHLCGSP